MVRKRIVLFIVLMVLISLMGFIVYLLINQNFISENKIKLTEETMVNTTVKVSKESEQTEKEDLVIVRDEDGIVSYSPKGIQNIAIYGTDERRNETPRSDVIMIIQYDDIAHTAKILSFPRDSRVMIPGYYVDKINHAYAFGGPELLTETIEQLMNIEIDHYIKLSFVNFKTIVDDVGGVKVNAQSDYEKSGIHIYPGEQVLNGDEALVYVRFRYDQDGDFGRIRRQQEVIESISNELSTYDVKHVAEIVRKMYAQNIKTDFEVSEMIEFIGALNDDYDTTFDHHTLKTSSKVIEGIWYELVNETHLEEMKTLFEQ